MFAHRNSQGKLKKKNSVFVVVAVVGWGGVSNNKHVLNAEPQHDNKLVKNTETQ